MSSFAQDARFTPVELASIIEAHREALGSYAYRTEMDVSRPHPDPAKPGVNVDLDIRYCKAMGKRVYFEAERYFEDGTLWSHSRSAYDGETSRIHSIKQGTGIISGEKDYAAYYGDVVTRTMMWCPECDELGERGVRQDVVLLLKEGTGVEIDSELTELFGNQGIALHVGTGMTVWVDLDLGGMIRRIDHFNGRSRDPENLLVRKDIPAVQQIDERAFPETIREFVYKQNSRDTESDEGTPLVQSQLVGKVELLKFDLNQLDFYIEFPPGTIVHDERTDVDLVVGSSGEFRVMD